MNRLQLLVAALIALPLAVFAHHGWSEYDATQVLKLTGTIEESTYEHPHGSINLKTPNSPRIGASAFFHAARVESSPGAERIARSGLGRSVRR